MDSLRNAPLDMRLSAFIDNELSETERQEVEALLATDMTARALRDSLQAADRLGRDAFEAMLKAPVSLDLVRSIKTAAPPRRAISLPEPARVPWRPQPSFGVAMVTSLLMFGLGAGAGYMAAERPKMTTYADMAGDPTKAWLDDVASYYRLYSRQSRHLVEIPANESAHIVEWLMATTGVSFRIPDLTAQNLEFMGARLFSAGGRPVGQLLYRNAEGEVIAIAFTKLIAPQDPDAQMRQIIRDDIGLVTWQGLQANYVLTGPSSEAYLDTLARTVAGII
ncbi:anti-sigma factor [Rhizobium sp. CSW-27]|uniref:anti-sigma factor family protein n=1 Tax=Rhizobium sp. CSW-27 TaxID=2839985 RepID=UPI001C034A1B|nr:anti-sigma factor [Rhizobium sp. CSW-27]MBT9372451.1 anti-sigma factor [Rhizobium sp. CSW-27]